MCASFFAVFETYKGGHESLTQKSMTIIQDDSTGQLRFFAALHLLENFKKRLLFYAGYLGVFFHFIGGFASGSFYVPYKKVKQWRWESYWIIGGLFSWLIVPPLAAYLTVPGFAEIIGATERSTLLWTYFWGVMWGIGGLTYGSVSAILVCRSATLFCWD
jgi:hypothetical protein